MLHRDCGSGWRGCRRKRDTPAAACSEDNGGVGGGRSDSSASLRNDKQKGKCDCWGSGCCKFYEFGWLFYGAFELAAGGVDVAAAGAADVGGDAGGHYAVLEGGDAGLGWLVEGHVGARVPNDEVDLAAHGAEE